MESSLISGSDVAALGAAPVGQDVRKRWLLLAAALVVGLVAAFAIGSAVKKTSAPPAPTGSLAQSSAASAQHASITPLTTAGAVPALHPPPAKPKAKPKTTPTNTSAASSSSSVASTSVSSSPAQSPASTQTPAPTQSSPPAQSGGGGGGSTSSGATGVSHGGGGGG
jgi:cytoskeletal protein RodZ